MICNGILIHDIVFDTENHKYNFQGDNDNLYKMIGFKYTINLKIMFKMNTYH